MAEIASSSFEQIFPYLYKPEGDSDELETVSGEGDITLETEHLESWPSRQHRLVFMFMTGGQSRSSRHWIVSLRIQPCTGLSWSVKFFAQP